MGVRLVFKGALTASSRLCYRDILADNGFESDVAEPTQPYKGPLSSKEKKKDAPSRRFTFICSTELANKVQAIARKEGFTIRALMAYMMRQGIDSYESKHGKIKKIKAKGVSDVM